MHLPPLGDLDLADDRHIVLALAGDHARVAPDARVQVDRHPPLGPLIVGMLLPEGEVRRLLFEDAMRAGGFISFGPHGLRRPAAIRTLGWLRSGSRLRSKRGQRRLAHDRAPFHAAIPLVAVTSTSTAAPIMV